MMVYDYKFPTLARNLFYQTAKINTTDIYRKVADSTWSIFLT